MFRKVLVANRGEIALRVFRACRELGIPTVAVFSEADRWGHYVTQATEAHLLGPAPARESYLRIDKILEIAKKTGADAIHPGYGFLAENADFSQACADAGVTFIGPPAGAIRRIGNKVQARRVAEENGIPVVPGNSDSGQALAFAKQHGYPILLKAASGGGGKGQRVVRAEKDLARAMREASSEAQSSFGDPTLFVERYVERPRHVEIQLLADAHGDVIHLGERECSIQRRHQKLLEESPSVIVDPDLRHRMGETACKLAKIVGYRNAGTCEFLVDAQKNFYFLEVNTRLQVEHPVTEMVTGIDLVKKQIEIAAGRPLGIRQEDVRWNGHAIEVRVCAEDPFHNFAPSIGDIAGVRIPGGAFVRVDSDITSRSRITVYYDSMIAKLIVWGSTRAEAIDRALRALREFKIVGVQTTIPFHVALLSDERFRGGAFHTKFIDDEFRLHNGSGQELDAALLASALEFQRRDQTVPKYSSPRPLSAWKRALE